MRRVHKKLTRHAPQGEKGSVLILSFLTFSVLFVVGQTLFSRTFNDMRISESTLAEDQAFYLAEAAKNTALADLRARTQANVDQGVRGVSDIARLQSYLPISRSLEFVRDYACGSCSNASNRFQLDNPGWGDRAYRVISQPNARTGNYSALIEVFTNGDPSNPSPDVFVFPYRYQISATGASSLRNISQFTVASGTFDITVRRDNFARYALFTNVHTAPNGSIVWFTNMTTFRGPVHSNDRFSFANNPSGAFTDPVDQVQQTARFYNNGSNLLLDADKNGTRDVPTFEAGFSRGTGSVPLPGSTDRDSQQRAALGLTSSEPFPNLTNGIYVPASGTTLTGGIYVQGDAQVSLSLDSSQHQKYTVQQGATTKEIVVYPGTNSTTVKTGATTVSYTGTPRGIVYVEGNIQALSGTVSNETQLTVASRNDLLINQNLVYEQYRTTPSLNANGKRNLLGILSWNGNVRIPTSAPNDLMVHGTVMAPNGVFTVDNYNQGSPRGAVTLLGGVITNQYGAFGTFRGTTQQSGYGRNFVYDTRMRQGQSPPYFPTITAFAAFNNGVTNRPGWVRNRGNPLP